MISALFWMYVKLQKKVLNDDLHLVETNNYRICKLKGVLEST